MLLAAGAVRALALCELPAPWLAAAALAVIGMAARDLRLSRRSATLALDEGGLWHLDLPPGERFSGHLAGTGHRSAMLIVLELERPARTAGERRAWLPPRRERRRVTVFADSVDAPDFSFLHLQLAFAASAGDARR